MKKSVLIILAVVFGMFVLAAIMGDHPPGNASKASEICEAAKVRGWQECLDFISTLNEINRLRTR